MPHIPAFCDSCGAIFNSGFVVENSSNISFSNVSCGPCPQCGGMGHIPDGVFNFIGSTIEILSAPERTLKELNILSQILNDYKSSKKTQKEVIESIEETIPSIGLLLKILPQDRGEFISYIMIIISIAQLILSMSSSNNSENVSISNNITINQVINNVTINQKIEQNSHINNIINYKKIKIGRNDPCYCNSGRKYKKCCLK